MQPLICLPALQKSPFHSLLKSSSCHPIGPHQSMLQWARTKPVLLRHTMPATHYVVSTKLQNVRSPETPCGWAHLSTDSVHVLTLLPLGDLFKCCLSVALCILSSSNDYSLNHFWELLGKPAFPVRGLQPKWKFSRLFVYDRVLFCSS